MKATSRSAIIILLGMFAFLSSCQQTPTAPVSNETGIGEKAAAGLDTPVFGRPAHVAERQTGRGTGPVVYVRDQGLYYDSIVLKDPLPARGPFQLLEEGPHGLETEFGPGDRGYVGGRWMEDMDGDGTFHYFLCPLLGPGRQSP